jgi:hypothetical protein
VSDSTPDDKLLDEADIFWQRLSRISWQTYKETKNVKRYYTSKKTTIK